MRGRAAIASAVAVLAVGSTAVTAAGAEQPTRVPVDITASYVIKDLCPFPIAARATVTGTDLLFPDRDGNVVKILSHVRETDVFSANGKTLTTSAYRYNVRLVFDEAGELDRFFFTGTTINVPLPGGKVFRAAGRIDFLTHEGEDFVAVPDKGRVVSLAPFCAALS